MLFQDNDLLLHLIPYVLKNKILIKIIQLTLLSHKNIYALNYLIYDNSYELIRQLKNKEYQQTGSSLNKDNYILGSILKDYIFQTLNLLIIILEYNNINILNTSFADKHRRLIKHIYKRTNTINGRPKDFH